MAHIASNPSWEIANGTETQDALPQHGRSLRQVRSSNQQLLGGYAIGEKMLSQEMCAGSSTPRGWHISCRVRPMSPAAHHAAKSFARQSPMNSMLPQTSSSRADRFYAGLAAPTSSVLSIFLLPRSLPTRRSTLSQDECLSHTSRDS